METINLNQVYQQLINLKQEVADLKIIIEEEFDVAEDVIKEIEESRKRPIKEFISHEDMKKEFG